MSKKSSGQLQQLFTEEWELRLQENPTFATQTGDHRYNDRLPGVKEEDFTRRAQALQAIFERLKAINRDALAPAEQLDYDFFSR